VTLPACPAFARPILATAGEDTQDVAGPLRPSSPAGVINSLLPGRTDLITGKGPPKRNEVFYFTEGTLSAVRIGDFKYRLTDQPNGWFGGTVKVNWPILVNLRLDPFERTGLNQSLFAKDWWAFEFWRYVFLQQEVAKEAQTFLDFPPMQKGASFNLEAVKEELEKKMAAHASQ
jgi:arylsulfatase